MKKLLYLFIALIVFFINSCEKAETDIISSLEFRNEENNIDSINKVTSNEILCISNSAKVNIFKDSIRDSKTIKDIEVLKDQENQSDTLIYVIKYEGGGFLLVSADKRYTPILALGDDAEWGSEDMGGIDVWIHCTKEEIKKNMLKYDLPPDHIKAQWSYILRDSCNIAGIPMDPYVPDPPDDSEPCPSEPEIWETGRYVDAVARWHQSGIFQFYSPADGGCNCDKKPAGCGPIAMAQVMRYYQSPQGTICYGPQGTSNCVTSKFFRVLFNA